MSSFGQYLRKEKHPFVTIAVYLAVFLGAALIVAALLLSNGAHVAFGAQSEGNASLAYKQSYIDEIGKQGKSSQACYGYAFAYADTITSGTIHTWKEYDANKGESESSFSGKNMRDTFDVKTGKDEQETLAILYDAINAGKPAVVYVDLPSGGEHWVTVVGYRNVANPKALKAEDFLMLDPAPLSSSTPESLTGSGYTLRLEDDNVYVSKAKAEVVKGAEIIQLAGGIHLVEKSGSCFWNRLYGPTALDTMRAVLEMGFSSSTYAIVATSGGYWDALAASGLAGILDCPILLTETGALSDQTRAELARLKVTDVVIVGGTAAVSVDVETELHTGMGLKVTRLAGDDAVGTANAIYEYGKGAWGSDIVIATADGYYDALSISSYAFANKAPVLLAQIGSHDLNAQTVDIVKSSGANRALVAGGTAAVATSVDDVVTGAGLSVERLAGADAYETSLVVATWAVGQGMQADNVGVATGTGYWDALTASPFLGKKNAVLILVSDSNQATVEGFVDKQKEAIRTAWVFGGTAAVSDYTYLELLKATA